MRLLCFATVLVVATCAFVDPVPQHRLPAETATCSSVSSKSDADFSLREQSTRADDDKTEALLLPRNLDSYHLLWSPGAWKKLALGTTSLLLIRTLGASMLPNISKSTTTPWIFPTAVVATAWNNLVLPLAASACCLLQVGLNLLSGGCAGFNTVLGPTRPFFLSLLLYATLTTNSSATTKAWVLRWSVALLPEALDLYNSWRRTPKRKTSSTVPALEAKVRLSIPTMGCVACIQTIDAALRRVEGVVEASSALNPLGAKGGYATVRFHVHDDDDPTELHQRIESLMQSVRAAGFEPVEQESLVVQTNNKEATA